MTEGMQDWKVTRMYSERHVIYIRADSEEGAQQIAESIALDKWTDQLDERGPDNPSYEVEEDE